MNQKTKKTTNSTKGACCTTKNTTQNCGNGKTCGPTKKTSTTRNKANNKSTKITSCS